MAHNRTRREFLGLFSAGSLGWMLTGPPAEQEAGERRIPYRVLGRTGLRVSPVGMGAMRTTDPAVVHHAIDLGVNYIDTAACYSDGNNERMLGEVLRTRRKEVIVATKVHIASEDAMLRSVEGSLKRLQTDVIDVIQLHGLRRRDEVLHGGAMKALGRMKKEGIVRFVGFSTHKNEVECIYAALETDFYDLILVAYNFKSEPALTEAITKAGEAGIGIVAMKTQAGGYKSKDFPDLSPHQAALRWVLRHPHVATTIPSMVSFGQVEENVRAMYGRFGFRDRKVLELYGKLFDRDICRFCGRCETTCPHGVPTQDLVRAVMYADGYGDMNLAVNCYREVSTLARRCFDCDRCEAKCAHGLELGAKVRRANALFGDLVA